MKKLLIVVFTILFIGLTGCTIDEKPVIRYLDVNYVIDLIDILPEDISEDDQENIENAREAFELLTSEEKELVTNIKTLEDAEIILESIKAEKLAEEERREEILLQLQRLEEDLRETVPKDVEGNLDLIYEVKFEEGIINVIWRTSDPFTLNNLGVVIPGREDIDVELSITLVFEGVRHEFTHNVLVKAIEFDPLPDSNLVFAYAYSGLTNFDDTAIETIDVINHAFSSVNSDGVVLIGGGGRSQLLELRNQGIRVNLCIGGYQDDAIPISRAASTQKGREKLAKSIVDAIEKYHFDGIDLDWEYPGFYSDTSGYEISQAEDTRNYTLLVKEIKHQVKAANSDYLVTAAVPGGPWSPNRYEIMEINKYLDYLLLMTYDMQGSGNNFLHTALYPSTHTLGGCTVEETVNFYVEKGASLNKLVIGAAFYGRITPSSVPSNSIVYNSIIYRKERDTVTYHWDDVAKAPYLYDSETGQHISYDNSDSIKYKIEYLKNKGLAGIMFWEFSQDSSGALIQAINDNI